MISKFISLILFSIALAQDASSSGQALYNSITGSLVKHRGVCPIVPQGTIGFCAELCTGDQSCLQDEKCCSNGCGHVCKKACPDIACDCPFGTIQDTQACEQNNCPKCVCNIDPCSGSILVRCPSGTVCQAQKESAICVKQCPIQNKTCIYCPNGYLNDNNGCPTCNCKPDPTTTTPPTTTSYQCPPMNKLCIRCPNGYLNDANGCATCNCAPDTTTQPPTTKKFQCPVNNKLCIRCPNGYLNDANGCPTCNCARHTTTQPATTTSYQCPPMNKFCIRCPNGYLNDEHGCATCNCAPETTTQTPPTTKFQCPPINMMCIQCPNGYLNDANGCRTCRCA